MISAPQTKAAIAAASVNALTPAHLFPAILVAGRTVQREERECPADHVLDRDAVERIGLGEVRGQQNRKRHLVELRAGPARPAAEPLVLRPASVRELRRHQVAQDVAGLVHRARRKERARALDKVARPNQMVAADVVRSCCPRGC